MLIQAISSTKIINTIRQKLYWKVNKMPNYVPFYHQGLEEERFLHFPFKSQFDKVKETLILNIPLVDILLSKKKT